MYIQPYSLKRLLVEDVVDLRVLALRGIEQGETFPFQIIHIGQKDFGFNLTSEQVYQYYINKEDTHFLFTFSDIPVQNPTSFLELNPSFVFSGRTQYYITFPLGKWEMYKVTPSNVLLHQTAKQAWKVVLMGSRERIKEVLNRRLADQIYYRIKFKGKKNDR